MKKWIQALFGMLAAMMICLGGQSISADMLDSTQDASLVLLFERDGVRLNGGTLECIPVAFIDTAEPASPAFIYNPAFGDAGIPLVNFEDRKIADELNRYALEHKLEGIETPVVNGEADFGKKAHGLYLIRQKDAIPGYEPIAPFVISVPLYDEVADTYIYEVKAAPKSTLAPSSSSGSSSSQSSSSSGSSSTSSSSQPSSTSSSKSSSKTSKNPGGTKRNPSTNTGVFENLIVYELIAVAMLIAILIFRRLIRSGKD